MKTDSMMKMMVRGAWCAVGLMMALPAMGSTNKTATLILPLMTASGQPSGRAITVVPVTVPVTDTTNFYWGAPLTYYSTNTVPGWGTNVAVLNLVPDTYSLSVAGVPGGVTFTVGTNQVGATNWAAALSANVASYSFANFFITTNTYTLTIIPGVTVTNGQTNVNLGGTFTEPTSTMGLSVSPLAVALGRSNSPQVTVRNDGTQTQVLFNGTQPVYSLSGFEAGNFIAQSTPGYTGDGSGLTGIPLASLAAKNLPGTNIFNVRAYGAVGDGVTDDSLAISNAWSAWMASGGVLYCPSGKYLDRYTHSDANAAYWQSSLTGDNYARYPYAIVGDSATASTWISTNLAASSTWIGLSFCDTLREISFVNHNTATNISGVQLGAYSYVEHVTANGWTGIGLTMQAAGNTVNDLMLLNDNIGLYIPGFGDWGSYQFLNCYRCSYGIVLGGTNHMTLTGAKSQYVHGLSFNAGFRYCGYGAIVGPGTGHRFTLSAEFTTNCLVAIGFPPALASYMNSDPADAARPIGSVTLGDGYCRFTTNFCQIFNTMADSIKIQNYEFDSPATVIQSMNSGADSSCVLLENCAFGANWGAATYGCAFQYSSGASLLITNGIGIAQINCPFAQYSGTNRGTYMGPDGSLSYFGSNSSLGSGSSGGAFGGGATGTNSWTATNANGNTYTYTLGVTNGAVTQWTATLVSAGTWVPTNVAGCSLLMSYLDLPANAIALTWTNEMDRTVVFTNVNESPLLTNSTQGLYLPRAGMYSAAGVRLTNQVDTLWYVVSYDPPSQWVTPNYTAILAVNNGGNFFVENSPGTYASYGNTPMFPAPSGGVFVDVVALPNGQIWTNGVLATTITYAAAVPNQKLTDIGNTGTDMAFLGYVKFVGIWTNTTVSATDIGRLHSYSVTH